MDTELDLNIDINAEELMELLFLYLVGETSEVPSYGVPTTRGDSFKAAKLAVETLVRSSWERLNQYSLDNHEEYLKMNNLPDTNAATTKAIANDDLSEDPRGELALMLTKVLDGSFNDSDAKSLIYRVNCLEQTLELAELTLSDLVNIEMTQELTLRVTKELRRKLLEARQQIDHKFCKWVTL